MCKGKETRITKTILEKNKVGGLYDPILSPIMKLQKSIKFTRYHYIPV